MEEKYVKLKLKNQLSFPLYLCAKELTRSYAPLLKKLNLTYTQYIVMMYLWERKTATLKKMAQMIFLDSGTLTPMLLKLENKGYITRKRSVKDERNLVINITKKGEKLKDDALLIQDEINQKINLNDQDFKSLYMLCYKLLFNIEKEK